VLAEGWAETWETQSRAARAAAEEVRGQIQRVEAVRALIAPSGTLQASPVRNVLNKLDAVAMSAVDADPKLGPLLDNFREDTHLYVHEERSFELASRTGAGFALERLDEIVALINPATHAAAHAGLYPRTLGIGGALDELLFTDRDPNLVVVAQLIVMARADLRRVLLELRRRLDLTRTRLSTIRRFCTWASWFARDELRALAAQNTGRVEDVLTAELARFLFSHGHTPLTRPAVGRLEPDILDPGMLERLYIEAKQYSDAAGARRAAAQGVRQVLDTVTLLAGTSIALDEAFVVVFALAGPRLELPPSLSASGLTIHMVLVDLVAWEEVGSRRKQQPLRIDATQLVAEAEALPPAALPTEGA